MGRRRAHVPLNVFLNGRLVGVLRRESSGAVDFRYAGAWLDWRGSLPVSLSLPLREDRYLGAPVNNVFDNLLPDNDSIRRRVAERVGAEGIDAFSLLTVIGHDCVGALQFLPDGIAPGTAGDIAGTPVRDHEIAELIENLAVAPLGMREDEDFRISLAGAQEKTALLRMDGRWFKPTGSTATTHILKPQIGRLPNGIDLSDSVENEYLCLKLADALGVPAATAEIADFGERRTLIVERFDRLWARDGRLLRLPQEDACQALSIPPARKYQADGGPGMGEIVNLLKGSDAPDADIAGFLRAGVIFWLLGATDGHAKNFSVFLRPGGRFRMAPLYDVLTAQPSLDAGRIQRKQLKLAMSVGAGRHYRVHEILPRHFFQTAKKAGVGSKIVASILDDLKSTAAKNADAVLDVLPKAFPPALADSVRHGIRERLARLDIRDADPS